MTDVIAVVAVLAFFALASLLVTACERIVGIRHGDVDLAIRPEDLEEMAA